MPAKAPAPSRPTAAASLPAGLFFTTPEQRVALARERFFEDGIRPSGLVPEPVIQSWARCIGARRAPDEAISFEMVTRSRVASTLARHRQLLAAAGADLSQLDAALAGTRCKAILTSPDGIVVHATPTDRREGRLMPLATRIGVDLGEATLGTSAPAVTAKTGEVSVVHGAEHFFSDVRVMYCAAAPIRDSRGEVAAVLDLSSEAEMFRFDAVGMVRQYATVIENRLLEAQSRDQLLLRFQVSPALIHTPLEGLAAVTPDGRVAWLNGTGASLVGSPRRPAEGTCAEALFGLGIDRLLALTHRGTPVMHRLPNCLSLWLQAHWSQGAVCETSGQRSGGHAPGTEPPTLAHAPAPTPSAQALGGGLAVAATLDGASRALIERVLAAHKGNVSRAARELGVSRGLLYRRLKSERGA